MQHLSPDQIQELKQQLESSLTDMEDYAARLDEEDPKQYSDRTTDNAEVGEEALEDYDMMENETLSSAADTSIAETKAALQRIKDGTYGFDEETGEPIPFERLKLFPAARTNVRAEEKDEN